MEARAALALARELMDAHGLSAWSVRFDRARRRAGTCRFTERAITLSRPLTELYEPERVREVVLHEIAHALVGPAHGHDATWRATARRIGSTGLRTVAADAPSPPAPWRGVCPRGHVVERFRRPSRPMSCGICARSFDPAHILNWTFRGNPVELPEHYAISHPRTPRGASRPAQEGRWRRP